MFIFNTCTTIAVIPILVGPLQTLLALLPVILLAIGSALVAVFKPSTAVKALKLVWSQKVPLSVLGTAAFFAFKYLPGMLPTIRGVAAVAGSDYAMFRGGPERRGGVPGGSDPTVCARIWAQSTVSKTFLSSPAVAGKYVYAVTANIDSAYGDTGQILCIDADDGHIVWQDDLTDLRATFSSPAVCDDYLVCGEGTHETDNARIVCLNRKDGKRFWEYRVKNHHGVESSPCIYRDKVYIGAGYDGLLCLQLKPDEKGQPRIVWQKNRSECPDTEGSPVSWDGKIYVGLGIGGNAICCLEAESGAEDWRITTPYPAFGSPSISDGKLYIGMGNGNFVRSARELGLSPAGEIWCVDLKSRQPLWKFPLADTVLGSIAIGQGLLYFGCSDGSFYCLNTDGKLVKKWNANAPIKASPALGDGHVYFTTDSGVLYALKTPGLELEWEMPLWAQAPQGGDFFPSSPVLANGHVYVGSRRDGLLCVGKPGTPPEPRWAGYLGGPGYSGKTDESPLTGRLSVAWTFPGELQDSKQFHLTAAPACVSGALYLAANDEGANALLKLSLNVDPGRLPALAWHKTVSNPIVLSPAIKGPVVYAVDGRRGDHGRLLRALDENTGTERWSLPIDDGCSGEFVIIGEKIAISNRTDGITALACDSGKTAWASSGGGCVGFPSANEGRIAVATHNPDRLALLDDLTGAELWSRPLETRPLTGPVIDGERILLATEKQVSTYSVIDGKELWRQTETSAACSVLVASGGKIAYTGLSQQLSILDETNGMVIKTIADTAFSAPPLLSQGELYYCGRNGVIETTLDASKAQKPCLRLRPLVMETPMIALNGCLYFGSNKGLTCAIQGSK